MSNNSQDSPTNDSLNELTQSLTDSVEKDLFPLELTRLDKIIFLFGFENLYDLIHSMFVDENKKFVGNTSKSLFEHKAGIILIDDSGKQILLKIGIIINKNLSRINNGMGSEKQVFHLKDIMQKQFLAENYMSSEIKDMELYFEKSDIIWKLETEKININKARNKTNTNHSEPPLKWNKEVPKLKTLSKKLYHLDYTEKPLSFYSAIYKGEGVKWLREVETLAYLINRLYVKEYIEPFRRNGYMLAAEELFCKNSQKSVKKLILKSALDKTTRSPLKYSKNKQFVDNLLLFLSTT